MPLPYSDYEKSRRIFETFRLIKTGQATNPGEIADLFETSRENIHNYVKELNEEWGAQITYSRSKKKYIIEKDGVLGFVKSTFLITADDVVLILANLVQSQSFMKTKMNIIIDNLLKLLPDDEAVKAKSMLCSVSPPKPNEPIIEFNVVKLRKAISEEKKVSFTYRSANDSFKIIKITPYSFAYDLGKYYIIGKREDKERLTHFRIDRMGEVRILDEVGEIERHFDIRDYLKKTWYMYSGEETKIKVKFKKGCYKVVTERSMAIGQLLQEDNDYFIYEFTANGTQGILLWLLGFGQSAEILEPVELREEVKEIVKEMYEFYNLK